MTRSSKGYSIVQKTHYLKWWRGSKERLAYWQGSCCPPNGFGVRLSILELHADFRILGLAQPTECFERGVIMVRNGEITVAEAKRIIRHYWWILPLTTVGLGVLGLLAAAVMHKRYTSQNLVMVDQPTVYADIVMQDVNMTLNRRSASMLVQILG